MADIGSTASALAYTVANLIYPNGAGIGAVSISGNRAIVKRGWPTNYDFSESPCSIASGVDLVTVMPVGATFRQISEPLGWPWEFVSVAAPTVTLAASDGTLTVAIASGATPSGVVGATIFGGEQANVAVSYVVLATDTPDTIAAALAAQIPGAFTSGPVATFPGAYSIAPATSGMATARQVVRRQTQMFWVSIWSGTWTNRDALGSALDAALGATSWIANLDGTESQILGAGAVENDAAQNQGIYRRDLHFRVTFDTVRTQTNPQMLFGIGMSQVQTARGVALQPFGQTAPAIGVATDSSGDVYEDAAGNLVEQVQQPYSGLMVNSSGYVLQDGNGNLAADPA